MPRNLDHSPATVTIHSLTRPAHRCIWRWVNASAMTLITVFVIPVPALSQPSHHDWQVLDGARLSTVLVLDGAGEETTGRLIGLSPDSLVLQIGEEERRFQATNVRRIVKRGDSLKNGALIGALVGGIFGALSSGSDCSDTTLDALAPCGGGARALGATIGAAAFAGIGVGIDALRTGRTTLYEAPAVSSRPSVQPRAVRLSKTVRF